MFLISYLCIFSIFLTRIKLGSQNSSSSATSTKKVDMTETSKQQINRCSVSLGGSDQRDYYI